MTLLHFPYKQIFGILKRMLHNRNHASILYPKHLKHFSYFFLGFMSSLAVGAYGFGAAIWIPIETTFVNPNNLAAVNSNGTSGDKYFEDPTVLNKVPHLFLLLGGIFAALQIIGLLFIQEAQVQVCAHYMFSQILNFQFF